MKNFVLFFVLLFVGGAVYAEGVTEPSKAASSSMGLEAATHEYLRANRLVGPPSTILCTSYRSNKSSRPALLGLTYKGDKGVPVDTGDAKRVLLYTVSTLNMDLGLGEASYTGQTGDIIEDPESTKKGLQTVRWSFEYHNRQKELYQIYITLEGYKLQQRLTHNKVLVGSAEIHKKEWVFTTTTQMGDCLIGGSL